MIDFDTRWVAGIAGAIGVVVFYITSMWRAKKSGANEVIRKKQALDLLELNTHFSEQEEIRREHAKSDDVYLGLSIDDLHLLRKNGYTSMSQITDAVRSGILRQLKGGL